MAYKIGDIFIYPYGKKWAWKYETSIGQKLFNDLPSITDYCFSVARKTDNDVYIEQGGKWVKMKPSSLKKKD